MFLEEPWEVILGLENFGPLERVVKLVRFVAIGLADDLTTLTPLPPSVKGITLSVS